jgi:hypothetical protein
LIDRLKAGDPLRLAREPGDVHDPYAIAISYHDSRIGYVPRAEPRDCRPTRPGHPSGVRGDSRERGRGDVEVMVVLPFGWI